MVSPSEVYENLLNPGKFSKRTCTLTTTTEAGEEFSLYEGSVQGSIIRLMKNRSIILKWRFSDWPEGHNSIVRFTLKELTQQDENNSPATTTKVILSHEWVPYKQLETVVKFWSKFWRYVGHNAAEETKEISITKWTHCVGNSETETNRAQRHQEVKEQKVGSLIRLPFKCCIF